MVTTEKRPVADLFDMLQPVCSDGSTEIHLARYDWDEGAEGGTLCALPVGDVRPDKTYLRHGCLPCAHRAVAAGIYAVRESDVSVINLTRFIDSRTAVEPSIE